ncbi:MAG TPA: dephospho-CoA kinase [Opitutaceae bacterium]|jgi:dephospho-CoA kinase
MGCGKSTAARLFEERGFRRIDTDAIVREQILTSPEVITLARDRHGPGILNGAGAIDRKSLAEKIFSDDAERLWLESIVHPGVFARWRTLLAESPDANWAVETPLLFEAGLEIWFDFTVCLACSPDQQLARLEQRGLNRALAGQRISKQLPLSRKIELAEFVLWNDGSLEFLRDQVDRLIFTLQNPDELPAQR